MSTQEQEEFYHYIPSLPAAIIAVILFSVVTIAHATITLRTRAWFCIPFVVGGIFEVIGYIGRAIGHDDRHNRGAYIIQYLFILLAPALFAASIYMVLGRIIIATHGHNLSLIRVRWQTIIFVSGDILSFLVQVIGGSILANADEDEDKRDLGETIILIGIWIQIFFFGFFILTATIFHYRIRASPTYQSIHPELLWERLLLMLYAVSLLVLARCIYRVIEYIQGEDDGYLFTHEWSIYVLDCMLMVAAMTVFWLWHPNVLKQVIKREGKGARIGV